MAIYNSKMSISVIVRGLERARNLGGTARLCGLFSGLLMLTACDIYSTPVAQIKLETAETWLQASDMTAIPPPTIPVEADQGTIDVDGGKIAFLDSGGDGDVILMLHPFTGSAESWAYQFPQLSQAGLRIVAPSARGTSISTAPAAPMAQQVRDLELLLDHLNIEKVHLLGSAYGGMVALRFAVDHPDRVKTLTLACTLGGVSQPEYQTRQKGLLAPEFLALPADIKELSPSYRHSNAAGAAKWMELYAGSASASFKNLTAEQRAQLSKAALEQGPDYADLANLKMPTHLIFGGADLYSPPSAGRMLHAQIPNSELTIIQETGHSAFWEQPEVFNGAVLDFIGKNP